jgi:periplasmic protein TonB
MIMDKHYQDWKDVAHSYYDKAFSLAILIVLFAFLVSPEIEIKAYQAEVKAIEAIDIPPEIRERIKPPETQIKPQIQIVIDDQLSSDDDDEDIMELDTISKTTLDPYEEMVQQEGWGSTPKGFTYYDDPPKQLNEAPLRYPRFAKENGIQGTVVLELEVLKDGQIGVIEVKKSVLPGRDGLDEAAIEYARQLEFEPAKSNGNPVAVWVTFPVGFYLE